MLRQTMYGGVIEMGLFQITREAITNAMGVTVNPGQTKLGSWCLLLTGCIGGHLCYGPPLEDNRYETDHLAG